MSRPKRAAGACLIVLAAAPAGLRAQETTVVAEDLVVTGGLIPVDAQSYARAVTIIDEAEITRRNPRTFADLLRGAPGVAISRTGGPAGGASIRIRGAEADHTLVLIDGVEVSTTGLGADLAALSPELIERVEILRGPQASLYGSGALGGVVNIITKGARRGETRLSGSIQGTTAPGGNGTVLAQGGTEDAAGALGLSFTRDEGWDASGENGEKDGLQSLTLNARGDVDLASFATLRGAARWADTEGEFDGTAFGCGDVDCYVVDTDENEFFQEDLTARLALDLTMLGGALTHTPSLSYSSIDYRSVGSVFDVEGATTEAGYQVSYSFGAQAQHNVIGAAEYRNIRFDNGGEETRDEFGYILDYQGQLTDALFVQGGLRFDDNDGYDDFLSWSLSASYSVFSTGTRLRASVGRAQRNPSFFDFAFSDPATGLAPEQSFGFDLGVEQSFLAGRAVVGATYFNETLQDEIDFAPAPPFNTFNREGESDRQGIELTLDAQPIDGLNVGLSYTWLDAEGEDGLQETRRPRHSGAVSLSYDFLDDRARIGVDAVYNGENPQNDFGAGTRVVADDYLVVDLSGAYRLTDTVELYGGVNNVFDSDNEDVLGYAGQPLTGFLGLRAAF